MSNQPSGFAYTTADNGDVAISHHGRSATTLRGSAADKFREDVEAAGPQELMAHLTGNYKHGNERTAKNHPRNSGQPR